MRSANPSLEPFPDGSGGDHVLWRRSTLASMIALAVVSFIGGVPAYAQTMNGTILLPDFGTPSLGRNLYIQSGGAINGMIGYVFRLTGSKASFSLTKTGGTTGIESFDIFFYSDAGGEPGTVLAAYNSCSGQEVFCDKSGAIPAGSQWAFVTLVLGANGAFRYSS